MDSTGYTYNDGATGLVPIKAIIPSEYKTKAEEWAEYLHSITLSGNKKTANLRTKDDELKDQEALEFIDKFPRPNHPPSDDFDPSMAYGFMLYNESGITKTYWTKYVGKLRQNKSEYFEQDKYLEWITEIFTVLNGDHPHFHDPFYYYKPGKNGSYYDVMNSLRTWWNFNFPSFLAKYLWAQDAKNTDNAISIEGSFENEDGGSHLAAEIASKGNMVSTPEEEYELSVVENFLKSFNSAPWTDYVPKSTITYRDFMKAIVDGSANSRSGVKKNLGIHSSVEGKAIAKIQNHMQQCGVDINAFADYIRKYPITAKEILEGNTKISFKDM